MTGSVAWISTTPIKGLRLQEHDEAELTRKGIPGDRAFFLVDAGSRLISSKRLGSLHRACARYEAAAGALAIELPGGEEIRAELDLGPPEPVDFHGLNMQARPVGGPFSEALSELVGEPVRLCAAPPERSGIDRGAIAAVTLLSTGSLDRLAREAGADGPVDGRRFRMNLGIDGLDAHVEDAWIHRQVEVGDALIEVTGNVGRCAVTTRHPDSGEVDMDTLGVLRRYRQDAGSTEPLPFGVYARVIDPGRARIGDPVRLAGSARPSTRVSP